MVVGIVAQAPTFRPQVDARRFGAKLDGVTDDTAAIQAAIDYAATIAPAEVLIPHGRVAFTSAALPPGVSLTGSATLLGKIVVGDAVRVDFFSRISGLRFEQAGWTTGTSGIEINAVTSLTVENCSFTGMDAAVRVLPFVVGSDDPAHPQKTTRLKVVNCTMWEVNYAFHARRDAASSQWLVLADCDFTGNTLLSRISGIDVESIDGFKITGNTFFMYSWMRSDAVKQHNIRLGKSDWLVISDNNLFEAGLDAIRLTDPRDLTITGNNIVWPGQRAPSDGIRIDVTESYTRGVIAGNHLTNFTHSAVGVYGTASAGALTIDVNTVYADTTIEAYYGATPLANPRPRYFADTTLTGWPIIADAVNAFGPINTDQINGINLESNRRLGSRSALTSRGKTVTVTAPTVVGTIVGTTGGEVFGGLLLIYLQSLDNSRGAHYTLSAGGGIAGGPKQLTLIAAEGRTTGAVASDPSFSFAADTAGQITATPVGSTSGQFNIYVTTLGNVRFT